MQPLFPWQKTRMLVWRGAGSVKNKHPPTPDHADHNAAVPADCAGGGTDGEHKHKCDTNHENQDIRLAKLFNQSYLLNALKIKTQ